MYGSNTLITKNRLATTLGVLPKQFDVTFDFYATKWISGWTNIFHFTTGSDCCAQGSRIPAVFSLDGKLLFVFAVNGNGTYNLYTPKLTLNRWYNFRINQRLEGGNYVYRVYMGKQLLRMIVNKKPQDYKNVKVFVGDNYHNAQPGYIENLRITNTPVVYAGRVISFPSFSKQNDKRRIFW